MTECSDTRPCPICAEDVKAAALKCRFCGADFTKMVSSDRFIPVESLLAETRAKASVQALDKQVVASLGSLQILALNGTIRNESGEPLSFGIEIHGSRRVDNGWVSAVVPAADATQILQPGEVARWSTNLIMRSGIFPEMFLYQIIPNVQSGVYVPNRPGDLLVAALPPVAAIFIQNFEGLLAKWEREPRPTASVNLVSEPRDQAPPPVPLVRPSPAVSPSRSGSETSSGGSPTPADEWKGWKYTTMENEVAATCGRCNNQWVVPASIARAFAELQSVAGKVQRWGQKAQHTGNLLTPGLGTVLAGRSGRRVLSQKEQDDALHAEFRCGACGSAKTMLRPLSS